MPWGTSWRKAPAEATSAPRTRHAHLILRHGYKIEQHPAHHGADFASAISPVSRAPSASPRRCDLPHPRCGPPRGAGPRGAVDADPAAPGVGRPGPAADGRRRSRGRPRRGQRGRLRTAAALHVHLRAGRGRVARGDPVRHTGPARLGRCDERGLRGGRGLGRLGLGPCGPGHGELLGLFHVNLLHNIVHLALQTDSTRVISLWLGTQDRPEITGVNLGHHDASQTSTPEG